MTAQINYTDRRSYPRTVTAMDVEVRTEYITPFNPEPADSDKEYVLGVDADKTVSWKEAEGGGSYELPPATDSELGGVKIGSGVSVTEDGTISVEGGGGSDIFKVTFEDVGTSDVEYTADKTYEEVLAAFNAGKIVVGFEDFYKERYTLSTANHGLTFTCISDAGSTGFTLKSLYWSDAGTIDYSEQFVSAS